MDRLNDLTLISLYNDALPYELDALKEYAIGSAWAYAYVTSVHYGCDAASAERVADRVRRNVRRAFRFPLPRDNRRDNQKEVEHA